MAIGVVNVPVPDGLRASWRGWLAPPRQPFFLTAGEAAALALPTLARAEVHLTPEERDTNAVWGMAEGGPGGVAHASGLVHARPPAST